jgi:hypothetical protein
MKNLIPNSALTLEHLPEPADEKAVFNFAMSFDGYEHFGSFDAATNNARVRPRTTLTDLRNELFMTARASKHCQDDGFIARYIELLPLFKKLLSGGRLT